MAKKHKHRIFIANWKMNLDFTKSVKLASDLQKKLVNQSNFLDENKIVLCPNFLAIHEISKILTKSGNLFKIGAQDCFWFNNGSYTGEISPAWLSRIGCSYVVLGHSERMRYLNETDDQVNKKLANVVASNSKLTPVICLGESINDKKFGLQDKILCKQIDQIFKNVVVNQNFIIAYEPIWAIGTGNSADTVDVLHARKVVFNCLAKKINQVKLEKYCQFIYGGSVDKKNVKYYIQEGVASGVLIGGASQKLSSFVDVLKQFS